MKIMCQNCYKEFFIEDDIVTELGNRVNCKYCNFLNVVENKAEGKSKTVALNVDDADSGLRLPDSQKKKQMGTFMRGSSGKFQNVPSMQENPYQQRSSVDQFFEQAGKGATMVMDVDQHSREEVYQKAWGKQQGQQQGQQQWSGDYAPDTYKSDYQQGAPAQPYAVQQNQYPQNMPAAQKPDQSYVPPVFETEDKLSYKNILLIYLPIYIILTILFTILFIAIFPPK